MGGSSNTILPTAVAAAQGPAAGCLNTSADGQCTLQVSLPSDAKPCLDSSIGVACPIASDQGKPAAGVASTPAGQVACPTPAGPGLTSIATCAELAAPIKPEHISTPQAVAPSVPRSSLLPAPARRPLTLAATAAQLRPNAPVVLTATSDATVTGTGKDIEIFDLTTGTLAGACSVGAACSVAYGAASGTHEFAGFITKPTDKIPHSSGTVSSAHIAVRWAGVRLESSDVAIGPGNATTLTATSDYAIGGGYLLQMYDADTGQRLGYCSRGNNCSLRLTQANAGVRRVIASLAIPSDGLPTTVGIKAASDPLTVTWLAVTITATAAYQIGSAINLTAIANADLTNTPWSIGIMDKQDHLVTACKNGSTCTAVVNQTSSGTFTAVVGAVRQPQTPGLFEQLVRKVAQPAPSGPITDIQARSSAAHPLRLLWGVDSCKAITADVGASTGLYPQITGILGPPDFWGRYMTDTVCPGISANEVAAAHAKHFGILPIYNAYNCSNVQGYDTGRQYAANAVAAAQRLGIPLGTGLAIDIEPPGDACPGAANIDTGFIHGWYDGIKGVGYLPVFYGDSSAGSAFAAQWCFTVAALPYIGQTSYLWAFQPSLYGGYMKSNAPAYAPHLTGCLGYVHAWQYQIGSEGQAAPDIDSDEATSELPLWYP